MSITAIAWAFKVEGLSSPAKFVLVKLADNANDDGTCWPSVDNLARHTELSRRSVQEQLAKLEQAGLVTIERRKTEGVNLPNMYHLNIEAHSLVANKAHGGRTERINGVANQVHKGSADGSGGVANQVHPNRHLEPSREPKKEEGRKLSTGNGFGKNGVTIKDPTDRIARFQRKLISVLGPDGWAVIDASMRPSHPSHESALAQCQAAAKTINKGWPHIWPNLEAVLSI